jgi:CubicO group peptidase (beta-lactamase class C family)
VDVLRRTSTDALVVMKSGRVVADYHAPNFTAQSRHILFSASKSVTSIVAGILYSDGLIDFDETVSHYVPELKSSAFADARIRDVLDMRVSLDFEETYQDPARRLRQISSRRAARTVKCRRYSGLTDRLPGYAAKGRRRSRGSLSLLLAEFGRAGSGDRARLGPAFRRLCRRAFVAAARRAAGCLYYGRCGRQRPDRRRLLHDPARPRPHRRDDATGRHRQRRRIVSQDWVSDTITNGSAEAWRAGKFVEWLPEGRYRNKWYQTGNASGAFFALGIHGQYLYVNPRAEMVVAKFSSQPEPVDNDLKRLNLALFDTLARLCLSEQRRTVTAPQDLGTWQL